MTTKSTGAQNFDGTDAGWRDPGLPVAERVELLLQAMTLKDKDGQLGSRWTGNDVQVDDRADTGEVADAKATFNVAPCRTCSRRPERCRWRTPAHMGLGRSPASPAACRGRSCRTGVPATSGNGQFTAGHSSSSAPGAPHRFHHVRATVYPAAIAWVATFNPDLIERMAAPIGQDTAAVGVHQGLLPVSDWCTTTAGVASRKPSARTRIWCPYSAPHMWLLRVGRGRGIGSSGIRVGG